MLACAVAAALVASLLAWAGPPGSDFAAHVYQRALFLEHGYSLWNNFWYAGRYNFVTYSIMYYPLAALLGIRPLAVASVAIGAFAFAGVVLREWGPTGRWSSRAFAAVWPGIILAAAFPFALGAAFALLALWALQVRSLWRFSALALLTFAASPLAFLLLVLFILGVAAAKRVRGSALVVPALALGAIAALALVLWRLFPDAGRYPFTATDLGIVCFFSAAGAALTLRVARARVLGMILLVYGLACVGVYLAPFEVGSNIIRLQYVAFPLAVLVVSLRSWRPLPICVAFVVLATVWNATPLARSVAQGVSNPAASESYWAPAILFLRAHLTPSYRVEAVDTTGHWPALYLAAARIPLARGWFRQEDFPVNRILYGPLTPSRYRFWLRGLGVRFVVLGSATPDYSSQSEAELLRSGKSGLEVVLRTRELTIFSLPSPSGIVVGPGPARVEKLSQTRVALYFARHGSYRLAVRYSPYWQPSAGCLLPRRDGMTEITAPGSGRIVLSIDVDAERAWRTLLGRAGPACGETYSTLRTPQ